MTDAHTASQHDDLQSIHALEMLRRSAEYVAQVLLSGGTAQKDVNPGKKFLVGCLEAFQAGMNCKSYLLAGRAEDGSGAPQVILTSCDDDPSMEALAGYFSKTFPAGDTRQYYIHSEGVISDQGIPYISAGTRIQLNLAHERHATFQLLLCALERKELPDPGFPWVAFLTYDKPFLAMAIGSIAYFIKSEHAARRSAFDAAAEVEPPSERRSEARRLLEFEDLIGLPPNTRTTGIWLECERDAFANQETKAHRFKDTLERAKTIVLKVADKRERETLEKLLFECYLLEYSSGDNLSSLPLLSQRIELARNAAKID